jgi:SAM-dependent methyltransferase
MSQSAQRRATDPEADRALKTKHRAMWALGDYPAVATDVIPELGPVLVEAAGVRPGDHVLDVAAGSGTVAVPAARAGGHGIACDLTPELFDAGRALAGEEGVEVEWREADAENLPFPEHTFDHVLSCVGVMFAPHHQAGADELVRVCRPGGSIGLISWTPEGFIGQMFATMKPYVAPPPAGVQPPPLWGREDHVRDLLGDRVRDVAAERRTLPVHRFADGAQFRDFFKRTYGPTIAAYRGIADDPARVAELDASLATLGDAALGAGGPMEWEYLLLTARKHG